MTQPTRGGFQRPLLLGLFIRDYMAGEIDAPQIDVEGTGRLRIYTVNPAPRVNVSVGAVPVDVRRRYMDLLALLAARVLEAKDIEANKGTIGVENYLRRIPRQGMRSHSFYAYWERLKLLRWIARTGVQEPSIGAVLDDGSMEGEPSEIQKSGGLTIIVAPQPRRFFRLTPEGLAAPDSAWRDPNTALYRAGEG